MPKSRENIALEWTRAELVETLASARRALEAFAEAQDAGAGAPRVDLSGCVQALHQVHGVLVMLELGSAAVFAEHLESVARALAEGGLADPAAAAECLMHGLLELPEYLDAQRGGLGDTLAPLLPVLNELRLHLRQPPFAAPDHGAGLPTAPSEGALERFVAMDGLGKVRRIRAVYQQVLLAVLKGGVAASDIDTLEKVAFSMRRLCEGTPAAVLWQVFEEYLEALHENLGQQPGGLGGEAVKLLRRMDSELRTLAGDGADALARPVPVDLVQQLIGAARARGHTSGFLEELRRAVSKTDTSEALASSGRRALSSAAAALRDDLAGVRDRVDLLLRRATGDSDEPLEHETLIAPLKQISSTMSLLGLESSRAIVGEQLDVLTGPEIDAAALAAMADALQQVDRNLASLGQGGKGEAELILDAAQQAVLAEARRGLELLKQGIVDYVSSYWDVRHLQNLPESLAGIAGALRVVPLTEAAGLIDQCVSYITGELLAGHVPDWQELDRFAGAVSGVDYYLERLAGTGAAGADEVLEYAQHSFADLKFRPAPRAVPATVAEAEVAETPASETDESEVTVTEAHGAELAATEPVVPEAAAWGVPEPAPDEAVEPAAAEPVAVEAVALEAGIVWPAPELEGKPAGAAEAEVAPEPEAAWVTEVVPEPDTAPLPEDGSRAAAAAPTELEIEPAIATAAPAVAPAWGWAIDAESVALEAAAREAAAEPEIELALPPELEAQAEPAETPPSAPVRPVAETHRDEGEVTPVAPAAGSAGARSPAAAAALARLAGLEDEFEVDDEVLPVFLEEIDEVLAAIDAHLPPWMQDLAEGQHAMELRRAFHTLKGSGRLVGANVLGDLGWSVEQMLNRVIEGAIDPSPELLAVVAAARAIVPTLREAFAERTQPALERVADVVARAECLAAGLPEEAPGVAEIAQPRVPVVAPEPVAPEPVTPVPPAAFPDALGVFREEAREHLAVLAHARSSAGFRLDEAVARAFHTLAGSAAMVGVPAMAELARAALDLVQALLGSRGQVDVEAPAAAVLASIAETLEADLQALDSAGALARHEALVTEAERLCLEAPVSPVVAGLLALPGLDALLSAQQFLEDWRASGCDPARSAALDDVLRDIRDLAEAPEHAPIAELVAALLDARARLEFAPLDEPAHRALLAGFERLLGQIDALVAGQPLRAAREAVAALAALELPGPVAITPAAIEIFEPGEGAGERPPPDAIPFQAEVPAVAGEPAAEAIDPELVDIFLEEAEELLEQIDQAIQSCAGVPDPHAGIEAMLRALHTLKGGARLAGLAAAGDAAHEFESWLIAHRDAGGAFDGLALAHLHDQYDGLAALIAAGVEVPGPVAAAVAEPEALPGLAAESVGPAPSAQEPVLAQPVDQVPEAADERVAPGGTRVASPAPAIWFVPTPVSTAEPQRAATMAAATPAPIAATAPAAGAPAADRRGAEEVVRVRAALLDQLVSLAGESSIIRGRVQQGLAEFGGALDEMETTIQRLREQLRRLEIETEAQILFRRERPDSPGYEDFDPLELDRYSQLQQLSRGLSESASDMLDLKETLRLRAGDTEALLVQQSRVNTQLQEGLMRSRMVPFARLLPRLRRTVRQVAQDLGKSVELVAYNVEGELDRSLLDRMVAPLEHMLRNAVDHGIELPADRLAAGKPEAGQIELRLAREGGDVVIEIRDDGAGIDVGRVRAKAFEQGLMAPDAELSDDELCQFIFAPGFSTARSVTQISGRGVGMDVVLSEVKQIGGSIGVSSQPGRGTDFLVRVPFTVSVNRALMVSVGEDLYALPLNTIEGIVLVRGDELAGLAAPGSAGFAYAGVSYQVRHLGEYLGRPVRTGSVSGSVPVVLVRSGEITVAVQVDGVQGSREIVVKSLGPQFAGVAGVSGATILGDGGVVVILDLPALVRGRREGVVVERKRTAGLARAVLVVDDSVTVRKVTSRLLERQGMEVMLAKDGIEAVAMLQERKPDVMLLDIEMPRMDGFEVLRHVRHDARLADLPVIMISSRTGAKHQSRAAELGVSHFLGKPFQEAELLTVIGRFLN